MECRPRKKRVLNSPHNGGLPETFKGKCAQLSPMLKRLPSDIRLLLYRFCTPTVRIQYAPYLVDANEDVVIRKCTSGVCGSPHSESVVYVHIISDDSPSETVTVLQMHRAPNGRLALCLHDAPSIRKFVQLLYGYFENDPCRQIHLLTRNYEITVLTFGSQAVRSHFLPFDSWCLLPKSNLIDRLYLFFLVLTHAAECAVQTALLAPRQPVRIRTVLLHKIARIVREDGESVSVLEAFDESSLVTLSCDFKSLEDYLSNHTINIHTLRISHPKKIPEDDSHLVFDIRRLGKSRADPELFPRVMTSLSKIPSLRHLTLSDSECYVDPDAEFDSSSLSQLSEIWSYDPIPCFVVASLVNIQSLKLNIVSEEHWNLLAKIAEWERIKKLEVSVCKQSPPSSSLCPVENSSVRELKVTTGYRTAETPFLGSLSFLKGVTSLSVCHFDRDLLNYFPCLQVIHITRFRLSHVLAEGFVDLCSRVEYVRITTADDFRPAQWNRLCELVTAITIVIVVDNWSKKMRRQLLHCLDSQKKVRFLVIRVEIDPSAMSMFQPTRGYYTRKNYRHKILDVDFLQRLFDQSCLTQLEVNDRGNDVDFENWSVWFCQGFSVHNCPFEDVK